MFIRRWSRRSKLFAVLAVVTGTASFTIVRGYEERLAGLEPSAGARVAVVVGARALTRGAVLGDGDLRVESIPSAFAPPGAIASTEDALGGTLVSDLAEGEAVTQTRLGVSGGPVASLVPEGLRAFVVRAGVPAEAIRAGDRVDVIATYGGPRPYSDTVAIGLEVLSLLEEDGGAFDAGGDSGPSLLLLVSPDTAERLAYATAFADLTVVIAPPVAA